jgi:hypothetical protein
LSTRRAHELPIRTPECPSEDYFDTGTQKVCSKEAIPHVGDHDQLGTHDEICDCQCLLHIRMRNGRGCRIPPTKVLARRSRFPGSPDSPGQSVSHRRTALRKWPSKCRPQQLLQFRLETRFEKHEWRTQLRRWAPALIRIRPSNPLGRVGCFPAQSHL